MVSFTFLQHKPTARKPPVKPENLTEMVTITQVRVKSHLLPGTNGYFNSDTKYEKEKKVIIHIPLGVETDVFLMLC